MKKKIQDVIQQEFKGLWGTDFSDDGIPVIKTNNMTYEGHIDFSDICKRNINIAEASPNFLQKGDLIIEKSGGTKTHSVGYVNIFEGEDNRYVCNNFILPIRPNKELVNSKYLFWQLHGMYESGKFSDCYNKTTGIQNLQKKTYFAKEINVPPKEEQQKIAAELDTIQSAIDNKKQQLSLLDEAVKSEFVEMFGENPVESGNWKVEKLETLGSLKNGMNFSPSESGIDLFCVNVSDFQDFYKIEDCKKLSVISLNTLPADDYFLCNEDIVFVRSNGNKKLVGRCIAVYPNNLKVTFSGFCIRFRKEKTEITTDFLLHFLKTDIAREKIKGKGANIQNLNQQILNNVDIPVPPIELQNQFATFVQQIDKSKFIVKQQIADLQELLDSKMQEYFG